MDLLSEVDIKKMLAFLIDNIYVRKMPLQIIFDHETKRQENLQILRQHPDTFYENLPEHQADTL